mgnify:CR=1 FL=1
MKVIILAGGRGSRISEYTDKIPKPMIEVGGKPILWHVMNSYSNYSLNEFIVALGYKAEIIKEYFLNYYKYNSNFTIDLNNNNLDFHDQKKENWKISLIDTGLDSMTGGRVKNLKNFINNETFLLSYGDSFGDINIESLLDFHKSHGKLVTVTAVRPQARFGELEIKNNQVLSFKEKPQVNSGWINGGYFVIEPDFLKNIKGDKTYLEKEPLENLAKKKQLGAYKHHGFWQCMDTKRDRDILNQILRKKKIF